MVKAVLLENKPLFYKKFGNYLPCLEFSPLAWKQAKPDISISSGNLCTLPEMGFISSGTFLLSRKAHKAAQMRSCANLTWKEREQQHWPWKFWQWSILIFCFIMSNLRTCHRQHPTAHSLVHASLLPGATTVAPTLANTQTHTTSHMPRGHREASVVTVSYIPPQVRKSSPPGNMYFSERCLLGRMLLPWEENLYGNGIKMRHPSLRRNT